MMAKVLVGLLVGASLASLGLAAAFATCEAFIWVSEPVSTPTRHLLGWLFGSASLIFAFASGAISPSVTRRAS